MAKTLINPKGIVEPTEMHGLCEKIRKLLSDRKNVALESDWEALQNNTTAMRCFTFAERNRIDNCYGRLKTKI